MPAFHWQRRIRFKDCDPAGIVFYPRYFEMMNDCIESFFDEAIGWSFGQMHVEEGAGIPLGKVSTRFEAPSRLGDDTEWRLVITRLGRATVDLALTCSGEGRMRLKAEATLVLVDLKEMKSRPWPEAIKARLADYVQDDAA